MVADWDWAKVSACLAWTGLGWARRVVCGLGAVGWAGPGLCDLPLRRN